MIKFIKGILLTLMLIGCSPTQLEEQEVPNVYMGVPVILDNDFGGRDPDNEGMLSVSLGLHNQKHINILALGRVSWDIRNVGTLNTTAQLHYNNLAHIPIGINTQGNRMRNVVNIASQYNPELSSSYLGEFRDLREFASDGCLNNNIGCGNREEVVGLYKRVLEASDEKVTIVSGGQLYNIAELLMQYPELVETKVKSILFLGKDSHVTLNGQSFGVDEYATWALHYIIDNLPDSVLLIEASTITTNINYQKIPNSRLGDVYTEYLIDSPTSFIYGNEHPYGVGLIDGYSIIDVVPLLHAIFGETLDCGGEIGKLRNVTFTNTHIGGNIEQVSSSNHYELVRATQDWLGMKVFLEDVIIKEDGKRNEY